MTENINEFQRLLKEIVAHLSSGTKMDARKAMQISGLAMTAPTASTSPC